MDKPIRIKLSLWVTIPALIGVLLALPTLRKQEREAATIGDTIGRYVVDRDQAADKRERIMLVLTCVSCVAAIAATIAAFAG